MKIKITVLSVLLLPVLYFGLNAFNGFGAVKSDEAKIIELSLKARKSLKKKDLKSFISCYDIKSQQGQMTEEGFAELCSLYESEKDFISSFIPDLKNEAEFILLKYYGDFVGFYAKEELGDVHYCTVCVRLFIKDNDGFKFCGKSSGHTKARPGGERAKGGFAAWKDDADIINAINTYPTLSLSKLADDYLASQEEKLKDASEKKIIQ